MADTAKVKEFEQKALMSAICVLGKGILAGDQINKLLYIGTKADERVDMLKRCQLDELDNIQQCTFINEFIENFKFFMDEVATHPSMYAVDEHTVCLTAYGATLDFTINTNLKRIHDNNTKKGAMLVAGVGALGFALKLATVINPIAGVIGVGLTGMAGRGAKQTFKNLLNGYKPLDPEVLLERGTTLHPVVNNMMIKTQKAGAEFLAMWLAEPEPQETEDLAA